MAVGTTLVNLLDDLRAECRISLNPAHNRSARDGQVKALQRKQEFFWNDFNWPHLRVDRFLELQAGQRFYDLAALKDGSGATRGDIDIRRITRVERRWDAVYGDMGWHIGAANYALYDSEDGQRGSPAHGLRISEDEQLEAWPIPDTDYDATTRDGLIKIVGIRHLKPLIKDTDRAEIDDRLLVLHCAAEYLASTGAKDAQFKLDQANALYQKLRGQLIPRRKLGRMFVGNEPRSRIRYPIAVYKAGN